MTGSLIEYARTHEKPRISANDLARYMVATDTGKRGIIRRARESTTPVRARYKDARHALRAVLCDAAGERRILASARDALEQRASDPSATDFMRDDAEKSLEVLAGYAEMRQQLAGYDYVPAPRSQALLNLAGVEVSVYCDVLIHRTHRDEDQIGGALFRLTKSEEEETDRAADKRRDMGMYAATLVHMHIASSLAGTRKPHFGLCWSVDVQNRERHIAPRTYVSRMRNLEDACQFIAAMWDRA
jgi:hypothetical protein